MLANIVGPMLLVQVILGGSSTVLGFDPTYHVAWGVLTFVVLLVTVGLGAKDFGRRSNMVKVGIAAILVFLLQAALGIYIISTGSLVVIVVHLANAFIIGTLVTYLIIFADAADKALSRMGPMGQSPSP